MKTAEEIINEFQLALCTDEEDAIIKAAQDEAWNEAIRAAAENAEATFETLDNHLSYPYVDSKSILKLLK